MILYISACEDGTTIDDFIHNNQEDEDIKEIIDLLEIQTKKNKERELICKI